MIKMWLNLNCIDFSIIVALSVCEWFLTMMNSRTIRWCLKIKYTARCDLEQLIPDVVIRLGHQYCPQIPPAVFNVQAAASGNKAIESLKPPCFSWADLPHTLFLPNDLLWKKKYLLKDENLDIKGRSPLKDTLENVMPTLCCQHWHTLAVETETAFLSFSWKSSLESAHVAYSLPQNPSKNSTNLCKDELLIYTQFSMDIRYF